LPSNKTNKATISTQLEGNRLSLVGFQERYVCEELHVKPDGMEDLY